MVRVGVYLYYDDSMASLSPAESRILVYSERSGALIRYFH